MYDVVGMYDSPLKVDYNNNFRKSLERKEWVALTVDQQNQTPILTPPPKNPITQPQQNIPTTPTTPQIQSTTSQ